MSQGLKPDFGAISNVWAEAQTYLRGNSDYKDKCNCNYRSRSPVMA